MENNLVTYYKYLFDGGSTHFEVESREAVVLKKLVYLKYQNSRGAQ